MSEEPSEANVALWADALHKQHVAEFTWMAGDALHEPMTVEQCGNCQRWGRYAAAAWEGLLPT